MGREAGTPLLLPRMRPIGDLDSDELSLVEGGVEGIYEGVAGDGGPGVPPAIPEMRRRLLLTRLVLEWGGRRGRDPLLPGQAAALAASLARFLDTVATEGRELCAARRPRAGRSGRALADRAQLSRNPAAGVARHPRRRRRRRPSRPPQPPARPAGGAVAPLAAARPGHRRRAYRRDPGDDRADRGGGGARSWAR